jgi:preprotein translocase subunit SecG
MLQTIVTIGHVLLAAAIIALVLFQRGKGADAGAAFGAGASGTVFGSRGTGSFLSRTTAILAVMFFFTSLGLAYLSGQRNEPGSVLERAPASQPGAGKLPGVLPVPDDTDLPALPDAPTTDAPRTDEPEQPRPADQ